MESFLVAFLVTTIEIYPGVVWSLELTVYISTAGEM
jgi:hypothetical protein